MKNLLIASILTIFSFIALRAEWSNENAPEGGSVSCFCKADDGNIYVGTFGGGLYRSSDRGLSWKEIKDTFASYNIRTIASRAGKLYVGSLSGGISISEDYGTTWRKANTGLNSLTIWGFRFVGDKIYVMTSNGFSVSTDGCNSWQLADETTKNLEIYALVFCGNSVFAGTNSDGAYRSQDGGATFSRIPDFPAGVGVGVIRFRGDTLFALTTLNSLYVSADTGRTWMLRSSIEGNIAQNGMEFTGDKRIYVSSYNGLTVSNDNGVTWQPVEGLHGNTNVWFVAKDGADLFAGTQYLGIMKFDTDEKNPVPSNKGLRNINVNSLLTVGNKLFAACSSIGLYVTTDDGESWNPAGNTFSNLSVMNLSYSGAKMFVVTYNKGTYYSDDEGITFKKLSVSDDYPSQNCAAYFHGRYFAATAYNGTYISDDEGASWTKDEDFGENIVSFFLEKGDSLIIGTDEYIYIYKGSTKELSKLTYDDMNDIFSSGAVNGNQIVLTAQNRLIVCSDDFQIRQSFYMFDEGEYISSAIQTENALYLSSTDLGVFKADNHNHEKTEADNGLSVLAVRKLAIKDDYIFAGTEGYSIYRSPLSSLTDVSYSKDQLADEPFVVRPNPCDDIVNLDFGKIPATPGRISVVNCVGETVISLSKSVTESTKSVSIGKLTAGIYFVLFTDQNGNVSTNKFIKK